MAAIRTKLGARWTSQPRDFVNAHGHPGACVGGTKDSIRLLVDDCSSCKGSVNVIYYLYHAYIYIYVYCIYVYMYIDRYIDR